MEAFGLIAERRSLERPAGSPAEPHLLSDLALGAERAVELSEDPLILQSELAHHIVEAQLPRLQLSSPLARTAQLEVRDWALSSAEELQELHSVLKEQGIEALRAAIKQQELQKLHRVLMEEGLPGLRSALHAKAKHSKKAASVKARTRHSRRVRDQ